jgi:ATP-dependent DNA helicase RecG
VRPRAAHEQSIQYVKGVGPHRLAQLAQLGIATVEDACYFPPMRYEDRTSLCQIGSLRPGQTVTVRGRLVNRSLRRARRGLAILEAVLEDGTGRLNGVWFNQPYLADQLVIGGEWIWYGTVEARPRLQMAHPELERVEEDDAGASVHMGRIVPVYPLIAGVSQRWLRQVIYAVVRQYAGALEDPLPEAIRLARNFPPLGEAVRELHFPGSWEAMERGQQRLCFRRCWPSGRPGPRPRKSPSGTSSRAS